MYAFLCSGAVDAYNGWPPIGSIAMAGRTMRSNFTTPDTGDAAGMLGFSLLAIAAVKYRRNL